MVDFDWMVLINKRAALKEQFPSLAKVRNERPGCAADIERQRVFREAAEMKAAAEHDRRWRASVEENARRRERAENHARAIAYKAHQRARNEMKEAS